MCMEDREIIDLFFKRDEEGILRLEEQYKAYCGKIASQILSQREDVEEVLNDTWLSAWNAIPPERPSFLKAYCAKITRNAAINRVKMLGAKKRACDSFTESIEELADNVSLSTNNVEEHIAEEDLVQAINTFLRALKKETRIFFVRRYFYHDDIKEIAERYGVTESKVKVSLHRTRNELKKKLQDEGLL